TDLVTRARHDPLTADLPVRVEDGAPLSVTADEALLRRALWNLVENAAKYGAPPITLSAAVDGERVALCVSDEGGGVTPADRERAGLGGERVAARLPRRPVGPARRGHFFSLTSS